MSNPPEVSLVYTSRTQRPAGAAPVAVVTSHPIQYHAPWYRALAQHVDLHVYFAHRASAQDQADAGYGVPFEWDVDLLSGYASTFLRNVAPDPNVFSFAGCDTPDIAEELGRLRPAACIVTGWYLKTYWQAIRACRKSRIPVLVRGDSQLVTPRSLAKRCAKAVVYRWMLRQFDGFLYVGERNREYLLRYGASGERAFFAPHFVDTEFFRSRCMMSADERARVRAELGIGTDEIVVLFVGRLVERKRPQDVLHALSRLGSTDRAYRAVFIGSGEMESALRDTARSARVPATFLGFQNQSALPRLYRLGDMLVLPSDGEETWGLVVNEAMACGLPAIVSDRVGCGSDLIRGRGTGEVFPFGDTHALATSISEVSGRLRDPELEIAIDACVREYSCEQAVRGTLLAIDRVRAAPSTV